MKKLSMFGIPLLMFISTFTLYADITTECTYAIFLYIFQCVIENKLNIAAARYEALPGSDEEKAQKCASVLLRCEELFAIPKNQRCSADTLMVKYIRIIGPQGLEKVKRWLQGRNTMQDPACTPAPTQLNHPRPLRTSLERLALSNVLLSPPTYSPVPARFLDTRHIQDWQENANGQN